MNSPTLLMPLTRSNSLVYLYADYPTGKFFSFAYHDHIKTYAGDVCQEFGFLIPSIRLL